MKLTFTYNKQKDIWCLMNYGKGSMNSSTPTKVYEKLVSLYGEDPSEEKVSEFIDIYIKENNVNFKKYISDYQKDWDNISDSYYKKAEGTFGVKLERDITVYLSINNRCPYSITESHFFVSVPADSMRKIVMHELWHFYTWYKFGASQETLGKQKYNDVKEALTVLLNIEFKDQLGDIQDIGYPQHKELRNTIFNFWSKEKNINKLWNIITTTKNAE